MAIPRVIKFRAWEKNEKMLVPVLSIDFEEQIVQLPALDGEDLWGSHFEQVELMQFTGLLDRNGVEIYEGDIVVVPDIPTGKDRHYSVEWSTYGAQFLLMEEGHDMRDGSMLIVIGNIYENSDLLLSPTLEPPRGDHA